MYQSPIEITRTVDDIVTKIAEKQDETIVHACMRVGVNVDRDELVKALAYDRHQYEKGYVDGRVDIEKEIVHCRDCKFYGETLTDEERDEFMSQEDTDLVCGYWLSDGLYADDFCSQGERRNR